MLIDTVISNDKKHCMIRLPSRFDVSFSGEFADICRGLPLSVRDVGIDMKGVNYIDATSIAMLIVVHSELGNNVDFYITNCSPGIARALKVSGVTRLMQVTLEGEQSLGSVHERAMDRRSVRHENAS